MDQVSVDFAVDVDEGIQQQSDRCGVFFQKKKRGPRFEDISDLLRVGGGLRGIPFFVLWRDVDLIPQQLVVCVGDCAKSDRRVGSSDPY